MGSVIPSLGMLEKAAQKRWFLSFQRPVSPSRSEGKKEEPEAWKQCMAWEEPWAESPGLVV